jgi:hypothetical protein
MTWKKRKQEIAKNPAAAHNNPERAVRTGLPPGHKSAQRRK